MILNDVKDLSLAHDGKLRIEWAGRNMQVLKLIGERFKKNKTSDANNFPRPI